MSPGLIDTFNGSVASNDMRQERVDVSHKCQSARNFDHVSALNFDQATETISGA